MIPLVEKNYVAESYGNSHELTDDEIKFSNALINALNDTEYNINLHIGYIDKSLHYEIDYKQIGSAMVGTQIGRLKIGPRVKKIQILTNDTVEWITIKDIDEAIAYVPKWVDYAKLQMETKEHIKKETIEAATEILDILKKLKDNK